MIKEIKYNGYTEVPSDYECPDGDLATALDVNPEDGSLTAMLPPTLLAEMPEGYRIVFIHKTNQYTHYIIYRDSHREFYWLDAALINSPLQPKPVPSATILSNLHFLVSFESELFYDFDDINAVGNTLMIIDASGIRYYLWQNTSYTSLGNHIPELPISFGLQAEMVRSDKYTIEWDYEDAPSQDELDNEFTDEHSEIITNHILGRVNKFIQEKANKAGKFIYPFLVRYAYRMYDDTLTMHSAPVLMVCSTDVAPLVMMKPTMDIDEHDYDFVAKMEYYVAGALHTLDYQVLSSSAITQLNRWKDIIRSVDIFISAPIYTYDQSGKIEKFEEYDGSGSYCVAKVGNTYSKNYISVMYYNTYDDAQEYDYMLTLPHFTADQVRDDVKNCHDFYLLESIKVENLDATNRYVIGIEQDYLSSLRAREVMTDDYDSHDLLKPRYSFNYNSRLNIANMQKDLFVGWNVDTMTAYTEGLNATWKAYVHIRQDGKEIVVKSADVLADLLRPVLMVYYPNPNAYKITLFDSLHYREYPLEAHDFLNGAFYFRGWNDTVTTVSTEPTVTQDRTVNLPNKVYTSEVNNPFNFPVLGINTVGVGEINGMASATKALSEGQFGQFPMYVFSTEGVWALETGSTGTYLAAKPVTRDVCLNSKSITPIDTAVLFAANRGIMLLSGSDTQCISDTLDVEQVFEVSKLPASSALLTAAGVSADTLDIKPFKKFVQVCQMLYDYTNQRIIVYEPYHYNTLIHDEAKYAYVYNLKSHKWAMLSSGSIDGINSYPECLAQTALGLADFSNLQHTTTIDDETVLMGVNGLIVTRPLKLDFPNSLKTIRTIIQRGMFEKGHVKSALYGSRDLIHWYLVGSSVDHYLRGISGTPYKFFRIALPVTLNESEYLFGCTIDYELKETNRLR